MWEILSVGLSCRPLFNVYRSLLTYLAVLSTYEAEKGRLLAVKSRDCGDMERGGGLGSRPKKMYGERLRDGVEYHLMSPMPRL